MGSNTLNMSLLRLPQSPLKLNNILQPSSKANQGLRNQNLQNCVQPDSTASDENKSSSKNSRNNNARAQELLHKHHHSVKKVQTPSVSRRNARERNRVKQVNNGFSTLRTHIPHLKNKTSKVDTLRAAVDYIRALRNLMGEPLMDEQLHQGPVLITEVEEQKMNRNSTSEMEDSFTSDLNDSRNIHSPGRPISVASDASMTELPSMVYQLPPPINPTAVVVEYTEHPMSPSSSTSSGSGRADIDSTTPSNENFNKHNYLDDIPADLQSWESITLAHNPWTQNDTQN